MTDILVTTANQDIKESFPYHMIWYHISYKHAVFAQPPKSIIIPQDSSIKNIMNDAIMKMTKYTLHRIIIDEKPPGNHYNPWTLHVIVQYENWYMGFSASFTASSLKHTNFRHSGDDKYIFYNYRLPRITLIPINAKARGEYSCSFDENFCVLCAGKFFAELKLRIPKLLLTDSLSDSPKQSLILELHQHFTQLPLSLYPPGLSHPFDLSYPPGLSHLSDLSYPPGLSHPSDLSYPPNLPHSSDLSYSPGLFHSSDLSYPPGLSHPSDLSYPSDLTNSPNLFHQQDLSKPSNLPQSPSDDVEWWLSSSQLS